MIWSAQKWFVGKNEVPSPLAIDHRVSASWYNRNTRGKAAFNGVSALTPSISLSWRWAQCPAGNFCGN